MSEIMSTEITPFGASKPIVGSRAERNLGLGGQELWQLPRPLLQQEGTRLVCLWELPRPLLEEGFAVRSLWRLWAKLRGSLCTGSGQLT